MKKSIFMPIITIIIAVLLVIFTLQNTTPITIKLWFWQVESPTALVILLVIAATALLCILFRIPYSIKRKKIISNNEKEIESKEREIKILNQKLKELEHKLEKPEDDTLKNTPEDIIS